jgi:hypothetical protein
MSTYDLELLNCPLTHYLRSSDLILSFLISCGSCISIHTSSYKIVKFPVFIIPSSLCVISWIAAIAICHPNFKWLDVPIPCSRITQYPCNLSIAISQWQHILFSEMEVVGLTRNPWPRRHLVWSLLLSLSSIAVQTIRAHSCLHHIKVVAKGRGNLQTTTNLVLMFYNFHNLNAEYAVFTQLCYIL